MGDLAAFIDVSERVLEKTFLQNLLLLFPLTLVKRSKVINLNEMLPTPSFFTSLCGKFA